MHTPRLIPKLEEEDPWKQSKKKGGRGKMLLREGMDLLTQG